MEVSEKMNQDEDLYARCYSFEERQKLENQVVLNDAVKKATKAERQKIAKEMIDKKISFEVIAECTGLSVQELKELKDSTE